MPLQAENGPPSYVIVDTTERDREYDWYKDCLEKAEEVYSIENGYRQLRVRRELRKTNEYWGNPNVCFAHPTDQRQGQVEIRERVLKNTSKLGAEEIQFQQLHFWSEKELFWEELAFAKYDSSSGQLIQFRMYNGDLDKAHDHTAQPSPYASIQVKVDLDGKLRVTAYENRDAYFENDSTKKRLELEIQEEYFRTGSTAASPIIIESDRLEHMSWRVLPDQDDVTLRLEFYLPNLVFQLTYEYQQKKIRMVRTTKKVAEESHVWQTKEVSLPLAVDQSLINLLTEDLTQISFPLSQFFWSAWSDAGDNGLASV